MSHNITAVILNDYSITESDDSTLCRFYKNTLSTSLCNSGSEGGKQRVNSSNLQSRVEGVMF